MGCAVRVTLKGNRRRRNDRALRKPFFKPVVLGLTFSKPEPPTIIMDHNGDVIRIFESRRTSIKRSLVKVPFWGSGSPDEFCELTSKLLVAQLSAFRRKIELVPPLELSRRRQRHLVYFRIADEISADRYKALA